MRKFFTLLLALGSMAGTAQAQTSFTTGNLIVVRVGSPDSILSNRSREVFLHEYTPAGSLVQTIPIPFAAGANQLTLTGTSTSEGTLALSDNKQYLTMGGYKLALGVSSPSGSASNADRVILRIGKDASLSTTIVPNSVLHTNNAFRSVASNDGTRYWTAGGTQGCFTVEHGSNTATLVSNSATNLRTVNVFSGQVYVTHGSSTALSRIVTVGSGLPTTSGTAMTSFPGLPTTGSGCTPVLFDMDPGVAGFDVLYLADDLAGVLKYSLVGGTWVSNGTIGSAGDAYRGLVGSAAQNGAVTLYSTRKGGSTSTGGGELVKIDDVSGYNASPGGAVITVLATAATNTAFRGVAFAPVDAPLSISLLTFSASITSRGQVLNWSASNESQAHSYEVERSDDGTRFRRIMTVLASGNTGLNTYEREDLEKATGKVYYRIRMIDKDGNRKYSRTLALTPARSGKFRLFPNPLTDGSTLTITHAETRGASGITVFTPDGRQLLSTAVPARATQTSLNLQQLPAGTYRVVLHTEGQKQSALLLKQ